MIVLVLVFAAEARRPGDIGFVDSATVPVRCHYSAEAEAARCDEVLVWAAEAWAAQVDRIGFAAPPPDGELGGNAFLDIYLSRAAGGAGSAWVDCDGGDPNCVDADPDDGRAGATSYVVIDPRTSDAVFRAYVHHEFNHTLQYATDFAEPFLSVWEATAVAAERWTDPDWPTEVAHFADYQATPWVSAMLQDGYYLDEVYGLWSWYEYGAVAWVFFLDAHVGDGEGAIGPALWEGFTQEGRGAEPDVLDALEALAGVDASTVAFAAERARMGTDDGPDYAAFAGDDGFAWREADVDAFPASLTPTLPPYPLGTSYFDLQVAAGQTVTVSLDGDPAVRWGLVLVDGADSADAIDADELTWTAAGDRLTLAVVNLGPAGFDAEDPLETAGFTVSVQVADPVLDTGADAEEGCGCVSGGGAVGWWVVALAAALGRRGRRPWSR